MNPEAAQKILALNRQFYQTFAKAFSTTRMRLQPGVRTIISRLAETENILDLGCGNGYLAAQVAEQYPDTSYVGLDYSPELLDMARQACGGREKITFRLADLTGRDWLAEAARATGSKNLPQFNTILAFAVLHHIPGNQLRTKLLMEVRSAIQPDGKFFHSNWQFLKNQRLRARIQGWESIGLTEEDVDPGDYLLDWRHGGQGVRYVHQFSEEELGKLAIECGFRVIETFYADGEGGNLGLYQVWQPD